MTGDKIPMNLHKYLTLYRAALKGDWEKASEFLNLNPGAERAKDYKRVGNGSSYCCRGWAHRIRGGTGQKNE